MKKKTYIQPCIATLPAHLFPTLLSGSGEGSTTTDGTDTSTGDQTQVPDIGDPDLPPEAKHSHSFWDFEEE